MVWRAAGQPRVAAAASTERYPAARRSSRRSPPISWRSAWLTGGCFFRAMGAPAGARAPAGHTLAEGAVRPRDGRMDERPSTFGSDEWPMPGDALRCTFGTCAVGEPTDEGRTVR